jgi:hypothetical protein
MAEERPGYNPGSSGKQVGKTTPRKIISLSNHFKGVVPQADTEELHWLLAEEARKKRPITRNASVEKRPLKETISKASLGKARTDTT